MTIKNAIEKIKQQLSETLGVGEAKSVAKILLTEITGFIGIELLINDTQILDEYQLQGFNNALVRLENGEPIQYIVGKAFFIDFEMMVDKSVLIPRPETEELVRWIVKTVPQNATIMDIGTGSGCIAIGLQYLNSNFIISACDVSEKALEVAQQNDALIGAKIGGQSKINFFKLDILENLEKKLPQKIEVIVSNPPYIPPSEKKLMPQNVLNFEPHLALFSKEENPLEFYEAICRFAQLNLQKKGYLFFELNEFYAQEIESILKQYHFEQIECKTDFQGKKRMIMGRLF